MRILFDENLNWRLKRALPRHEVTTVQQIGWAGVTNVVLLRRTVDAGFDVQMTRDNNLVYQQDLSSFASAVVVLRLRGNRLEDALPIMPEVLRRLPLAQKGERTVIEG